MARRAGAVLPAAFLLYLALLVPPAPAVIPSGNLVQNPGAEADTGSTDSSCGGNIDVGAWNPETGNFSAVQYGTGGFAGFPSAAVSSSFGGGNNLFTGGCASQSAGEQTINVSGAAPEIDAGTVAAQLSGYLGGYGDHPDNAVVKASFLAGGGGELGSLTIGPVTPSDRFDGSQYQNTLLARSTSGTVPAGTRSVRVLITMTRVVPDSNDGYADNLSLTLAPKPPGGSQPGGGSQPPAACPAFRGLALASQSCPGPVPTAASVGNCSGKHFEYQVGGGTWIKGIPKSLKAGDRIHTGFKSRCTVTFPDGSTLKVEPMSYVTIQSVDRQPDGRLKVRILPLMSEVKLDVRHKLDAPADYEIATPTATASVRGTKFSAVYDQGQKATLLSVTEGSVSVDPRGRGLATVEVAAGREVEVGLRRMSPVSPLGKAGAPPGGVNMSRARALVLNRIAKARRCRENVSTVNLARLRKAWRVSTKVSGKARGTARWTVEGRTARPANPLARRIAKNCR